MRFLLPISLVCACTATPTSPDEPGDNADDSFIAGKADGQCVEPGSAHATGVLALVNDPDVSFELLDEGDGVGLDRRAAQNIVDARPFETLEELDEVPYVGVNACKALASYACNEAELCRADVRMVSWNLRHFPLTDSTEESVVELIETMDPDIVGIQEVRDPDAFEDLLEELPGYVGIQAERGFQTGVAVLVREAAIEIIGVENLFVGDSSAFPRPVLAVTVFVRGSLEPTVFTFAVVHLKASLGDKNEQRRRDAVEKLRAHIDAERSIGHDNIVIVGDWNDHLTDSASHNVFTELLEPDAATAFLTDEAAEAGEFTLIPFEAMLDHVLVTDETSEILQHEETEVLALDETWSDDYVEIVSDHRPVMSRFTTPLGY